MKQYLTVKDVARLIGVTPLTLRNWDKRGVLVAFRNPINNYRMYKREHIDLLIRKIEGKKKMDDIRIKPDIELRIREH